MTIIYSIFRRRCWKAKVIQDRRKRNSRPNTRLTPYYHAYFIVPPEQMDTDTEGVITDETRTVLTTRVVRQKFLDETMTQAFIRKYYIQCIIVKNFSSTKLNVHLFRIA